MAAITICSDFGATKTIKSLTVSTLPPSICHEVVEPDATILVFFFFFFYFCFFTFAVADIRDEHRQAPHPVPLRHSWHLRAWGAAWAGGPWEGEGSGPQEREPGGAASTQSPP